MPAALRHRWDHAAEQRFACTEFPDGNARNIRRCMICQSSWITVIPPFGFPWHEFKPPDGEVVRCVRRPPCNGGVKALREHV